MDSKRHGTPRPRLTDIIGQKQLIPQVQQNNRVKYCLKCGVQGVLELRQLPQVELSQDKEGVTGLNLKNEKNSDHKTQDCPKYKTLSSKICSKCQSHGHNCYHLEEEGTKAMMEIIVTRRPNPSMSNRQKLGNLGLSPSNDKTPQLTEPWPTVTD